MMAEFDQPTEKAEMKTEISEGDFANAENDAKTWRPRRDLNPSRGKCHQSVKLQTA